MYYPCFAYSEKDETFEIAIDQVNRVAEHSIPFTTDSQFNDKKYKEIQKDCILKL